METPKEWSEFADEMKQIFDTDLNSENELKKAKQAEFASQVNELKIHDPTAQLQADKAELVSYLEHVLFYVFWNGGNLNLKDKERIESLIQKHKQ